MKGYLGLDSDEEQLPVRKDVEVVRKVVDVSKLSDIDRRELVREVEKNTGNAYFYVPKEGVCLEVRVGVVAVAGSVDW